jgi:hypothetical protein
MGEPAQGTISLIISIGGKTIGGAAIRTADHPNVYQNITLPVAHAGSLTTRTNDAEGVITLAGGHDVANGTYDVYWSGGMRYEVSCTVDVNACTITGGAGDNLPAKDTALTVAHRVTVNCAIDGDAVKLIGIWVAYVSSASVAPAHVQLDDATGDTIDEIDLLANQAWPWDYLNGQGNPLTGDPITIGYASNGSATEVGTLDIVSLEDSTP